MPKPTFFNLPDDKRERIVELAIDEFSEHPYKDASISRIVARAGIAKGSFYQYFEDKLDLFRWLMFDVAGRQKVDFIASRPPPPSTGLFDLLEHMLVAGLQYGMANPRLARIADLAFHKSPDPALASFLAEGEAMSRKHFRGLLEQAATTGELRPGLDLDLATDFTLTVLRHGLDVVMKRRFGFDMWECCTDPDLSVTDEQAHELARDLLGLLRDGLGSGTAPTGPLRVDFDAMRDTVTGAKR